MLTIANQRISMEEIVQVIRKKEKVGISKEKNYRSFISKNADFLQSELQKGTSIYGTTTGFGDSSHQHISEDEAQELQKRLILYHHCGTGAIFSPEEARAMMLVRLISLAKGYSGVRASLLETLAEMINEEICPQIPEEGSVGASGDLTPLSYIAGAMMGLGKVFSHAPHDDSAPENDGKWNWNVINAAEALEAYGLAPFEFAPKEALAMMNGTAIMTALLLLALEDIRHISHTMEILTALTLQSLQGYTQAMDERIHKLKPFPGQCDSARHIWLNLEDSPILQEKPVGVSNFRIQDVYSLRCTPHIVGVLRDTYEHAKTWAEIELNSVNDNPLFFHEQDAILMGGNFYGGYIGQAADSLKIAVAQIADLADRQMALLVDEKFSRGLPANLILSPKGQINHGFKGMQITCSALTAEVLKNAAPATIFSRVTECCNQDKVSLGTIAARDLRRSITLTSRVLAIHALATVQAVDLRGGIQRFSPFVKDFYDKVRRISGYLECDRPMDTEIERVAQKILGKE